VARRTNQSAATGTLPVRIRAEVVPVNVQARHRNAAVLLGRTKEPDPFPGAIGAFRKMLDQAEVKYVFFESPGAAHEWQA
jgi:hypothetical protein